MSSRILLAVLAVGLLPTCAKAQKALPYSVGKYGTRDYESLEFHTEKHGRGDIYYSYGKPVKSIELTYLGKDTCQGSPCFKVQFPNRLILYVAPQKSALLVTDGKGKYQKTFMWEYEGPVNGIGTFCEVCAADEDEAMALIQQYFLQ